MHIPPTGKLLRHVNNVLGTAGKDPSRLAEYERIIEDGWRALDWSEVPSAKSQREHIAWKTEYLARARLAVSVDAAPYCLAEPHPDLPHVMRGDVSGAKTAEYLAEHIPCGVQAELGASGPCYKTSRT